MGFSGPFIQLHSEHLINIADVAMFRKHGKQ